MSRLIDAESPQNRIYVSDLVIEEMKKIPTVEIDRPTRSRFKRMAVPTVDAVPVVRCLDCRYWGDADEIKESTNGVRFARCKVHGHAVDGASYGWCPEEDDFCSLGERKENERS